MASQPFLVADSDEENGENISVSFSSSLSPPFVSFAHITLIEDIPILGPQACIEFTLNVNVSDLFAKNPFAKRRVKSSGGYVSVEGERDKSDDRSRVHRIINPRIPLPSGKTVKSVRLKHLSNCMLSITVNMEDIKAGEEPPAVRTLLVCEGVVQGVPSQVKLVKERPKLVRFVMQEQLGELAMQLQRVERLAGENLAPKVPSSSDRVVDERTQPGQVSETRSNEEAVDKVANTEELVERQQGGVSSGKLAEEPDVNAEQINLEYDTADPRYPNVDPKTVWAELTTIANYGAVVGWDLEAQDKNHSRCVF